MDKSSFEEQIKKALEWQEPLTDLSPKIIFAIARRRRFYVGLEIFGFSVLSLASLSLLIFAVGELGRQLIQAGTFRILSLVISDFMVVLANWQEFSLSFLESLPILPAILMLGGVLLLLVSIKFIFDNLPKLNWQPNLKNSFHY